ncbi:MAG: glycosyltransferase [Sedimentisphaerales bacterium]|nr:glycosyltransferase [Sedimentisphaerales bacterium]
MDISIIIPAFEESHKIRKDIETAWQFLQDHSLAGEIILVDDGSSDDTATVAEAVGKELAAPLRVIRYAPNRGKGHAVRTGILQSEGDYIMFADAGTCVPYDNALRGLDLIRSGQCDIANGSRRIDGCQIDSQQTAIRRFCSKSFRKVIRLFMGVPRELTDTQCGFKVYRGNVARQLYALSTIDGFTFDVEIILLARRKGYRIREFPVDWTCDCDSRISIHKTSIRVLKELLAIRRNVNRHKEAQSF